MTDDQRIAAPTYQLSAHLLPSCVYRAQKALEEKDPVAAYEFMKWLVELCSYDIVCPPVGCEK